MATITAPAPPKPTASAVDPDEKLFEKLGRTERKAEIVNGKVRLLPMSGPASVFPVEEIVSSLRNRFGRRIEVGTGFGDGLDYKVALPHRRTFRPDASFYAGPNTELEFINGPPLFAVEVRSRDDYKLKGQRAMLDKRRDYFAAGTLVIWDVDPVGADVVRVFRDGNAEVPAVIYRRGDLAEAEPAAPGWTMPVDDLFLPGR